MKLISLLLLVVALAGCKKTDDLSGSVSLTGKWIEMQAGKDTLTFNPTGLDEHFKLDRGKEMQNGYLLPKYGAGLYRYKLLEGKISMNSMLSSNSAFNEYDFTQSGNKLIIGNFYNSPLGNSLTFRKLR